MGLTRVSIHIKIGFLFADHDVLLEELNEEDQQLKTELEMLVSRLQVNISGLCFRAFTEPEESQESDTSLYKPALDAIRDLIRTSTSSMTAVPKPLKFLRPHFDELAETYERWQGGDDKVYTVLACKFPEIC